jgi:hypothetical protein
LELWDIGSSAVGRATPTEGFKTPSSTVKISQWGLLMVREEEKRQLTAPVGGSASSWKKPQSSS